MLDEEIDSEEFEEPEEEFEDFTDEVPEEETEEFPEEEFEESLDEEMEEESEETESSEETRVKNPEKHFPDFQASASADGEAVHYDTVILTEERNIMSTPLTEYSVTEGLLLIIVILLLLNIVLNFGKRLI